MSVAEKIIKISENVPKVYEAGKSFQSADFANAYVSSLNNSTDNFAYAFSGHGWNDKTYGVVAKNINSITVTKCGNIFYVSEVTDTIVPIDMTNCTSNAQSFAYSKVETIKKLISSEETTFDKTFNSATKLKNINFEGTVAQSISLQNSALLSKESIESLFSALSDTASEQTVTLSNRAVNNAFETATGAADGSSSAEWLALIGTKSNWTVSLI